MLEGFQAPFKANNPNEAALPPTRPPTRMKIATTEATSLSSGSILGFRAGEEERMRALVLEKGIARKKTVTRQLEGGNKANG